VTYYSGAPGSLTNGSTAAISLSNGQNIGGGGDSLRAVETCDPWHPVHGTRTFHEWFNATCIEPPLAGSPATVGTYSSSGAYTPPAAATFYSTGNGNFAPKVDYFLPGYTNFETALIKYIPIENKFTFQLRVETYNTFNHTEFNAVNGTATFANANSQGAANPQTGATFGQLTGTANPRYMQLAARIDF
jgi:hypothetical protein